MRAKRWKTLTYGLFPPTAQDERSCITDAFEITIAYLSQAFNTFIYSIGFNSILFV
uniref:Uncharacterized protein n=1 Tax=Anguilla anguilla TaxID=7936 RepID=A0A0E9W8W8_ANGAN